MIQTSHCGSLWRPAGHKNNPSDLPRWSQNDFVSRDEYSPTAGSGGWVGARCSKLLVSLLLTLTFDSPAAHFRKDLRENNAATAQQPSVLTLFGHTTCRNVNKGCVWWFAIRKSWKTQTTNELSYWVSLLLKPDIVWFFVCVVRAPLWSKNTLTHPFFQRMLRSESSPSADQTAKNVLMCSRKPSPMLNYSKPG